MSPRISRMDADYWQTKVMAERFLFLISANLWKSVKSVARKSVVEFDETAK
jgi:hypothetical protein